MDQVVEELADLASSLADHLLALGKDSLLSRHDLDNGLSGDFLGVLDGGGSGGGGRGDLGLGVSGLTLGDGGSVEGGAIEGSSLHVVGDVHSSLDDLVAGDHDVLVEGLSSHVDDLSEVHESEGVEVLDVVEVDEDGSVPGINHLLVQFVGV